MVIVGLGNPGKQYDKTRHNVGFMAVDKLAESKHITFKMMAKYNAEVAEFNENGENIYILKPHTYMNLSGDALSAFIKNKNITSKEIVIIHDDMDLPLAKLRIKQNGSSGGHNGIKSIINNLGTQEFIRIRIGIGREKDASSEEVVDYVLSKFNKEDSKVLNDTLEKIPDIVESLQLKGVLYVMNTYNGAK